MFFVNRRDKAKYFDSFGGECSKEFIGNKNMTIEYKLVNQLCVDIFLLYLKLVSAIFYQIFISSPNDSPSKTIKNVFNFIKKALFVLKMFKCL